MKYTVDLGYPLTDRPMSVERGMAYDHAIGEIVGQEWPESSGFGFGVRDMQYVFETKEQADNAAASLEASDIRFEYVSVFPNIDDQVVVAIGQYHLDEGYDEVLVNCVEEVANDSGQEFVTDEFIDGAACMLHNIREWRRKGVGMNDTYVRLFGERGEV